MKVVFLDFNGVLDTYDEMDVIDKSNLNRLKKIVDVTGAKIVISSSNKNNYYRNGYISGILKYLINSLLIEGFDVIGLLPMGDSREEEIKMYLSMHPEINEFVILDDDYEMPSFKKQLIKLPSQMIGSLQRGLEDKHVYKAIEILGEMSFSEKQNRKFLGLKLVPKEE